MLIRSDARHIPIADESVHCCITSPPYWGLRAYEGNPGMIGLEPTFEEHLENLVEVFREVRRVLRKDGTLFLNYGDAYARGVGRGTSGGPGKQQTNIGSITRPDPQAIPVGLKTKDLMMMPARVAMALQKPWLECRGCGSVSHEIKWGRFPNGRMICPACELSKGADVETPGWWLRSEIVWHKCLSGGAWLYARTQKGVGPHMLKDLVRLDPATVQLWNGTKWTQVVGWTQSTNPADPREIVLRSGERIGCTADHRWPTKNRGLVETRDLVVGDILLSALLPDEGHEPKWLTEDALWFAGMYLAEGSMSGETIQLSGNVKETERWRRIQALCEYYGAMPSLYENGNKQAIHIDRCSALLAILRTVLAGRTAKDKRLSSQVWGWRNSALKHIVTGYLEGDGSPDVGRVRLGFTRNYSLERDLRCLAARLGATITLKPSVSTIGDKKYPSFRGEWRWERSGHHNELDRFEVMEIRRSRARKFWDVSVEDDPHLFALSSGVLTHNSNPMPESVTDRPTSAHEKVFLLSKSAKYFYDAEAVRVPAKYPAGPNSPQSIKSPYGQGFTRRAKVRGHDREHEGFRDKWDGMTKGEQQSNGANLRNVWKIATQAVKESHFATFPEKLVQPCILAGTSEKGCCEECGAPWVRVVSDSSGGTVGKSWHDHAEDATRGNHGRSGHREMNQNYQAGETTGWAPTCDHDSKPVPAVCLDPFAGSGTVVRVAERFNRRGIGCDLTYQDIAKKRTTNIQRRLI